MFQLGFDTEAFGLLFTSDYKAKVLAGEEGKVTRLTVEKFLEKVVSSCTDLSFSKDKMLREFLFTDSEITYERIPVCDALCLKLKLNLNIVFFLLFSRHSGSW